MSCDLHYLYRGDHEERCFACAIVPLSGNSTLNTSCYDMESGSVPSSETGTDEVGLVYTSGHRVTFSRSVCVGRPLE